MLKSFGLGLCISLVYVFTGNIQCSAQVLLDRRETVDVEEVEGNLVLKATLVTSDFLETRDRRASRA